jgi:fructan beta-fructosidase
MKKKWVLISINPGAPNGGSGTQYFIGDYDGTHFKTDQNQMD